MLDRRRNVPKVWGIMINRKDRPSSTTFGNVRCEILKRGWHVWRNAPERNSSFEKLLSLTKIDTIIKRIASAIRRCVVTYYISRRPLNFCCIFNCVLKNMPLIMWGKQNLRAVKELFHILGLSFHVLSQSSEHHTAWICWHFKLVFASPALYTILILVYPILF